MKTNIMMNAKIEKVVLSIGGTAERLEKGVKLFERFFEMKPKKVKSKRRIPSLSVRPGLEVGCFITLRGKKAEDVLKRMLSCIGNKIKKKQISQNSFSFGIKE